MNIARAVVGNWNWNCDHSTASMYILTARCGIAAVEGVNNFIIIHNNNYTFFRDIPFRTGTSSTEYIKQI